LGETSRLAVGFSKTILGRQLFNALLIGVRELRFWVDLEPLHFLDQLFHLLQPLIFALDNHLIDFIHLPLIPFNLSLVVVAAILEELARSKHFVVVMNQKVWLEV